MSRAIGAPPRWGEGHGRDEAVTKLGIVIEASPVIFLASSGGDFYWAGLKTQLEHMVRAGRAPGWLLDNILMTADPDEVPRFYKRILRLG